MHHPEEAVSSFGLCKGSGGEFAGAEFAAGNRPWGNFSAGNSSFPLRGVASTQSPTPTGSMYLSHVRQIPVTCSGILSTNKKEH